MFQKSRNHLKILGARRMTRSKFQIEDPQILDDTVNQSVNGVQGNSNRRFFWDSFKTQ